MKHEMVLVKKHDVENAVVGNTPSVVKRIYISDGFFSYISAIFQNVPCFWNDFNHPKNVLSLYFTTIYPATSAERIYRKLSLLNVKPEFETEFQEFGTMMRRAAVENLYIVYFG